MFQYLVEDYNYVEEADRMRKFIGLKKDSLVIT